MTKRGHLNGKLQRGTHTTINQASERLVQAARKLADKITGIRPGYIDGRAHSKKMRWKFKQVDAGLQIVALDKGSAQEITIFTGEPDLVERILRRELSC
ncbi:hypothetical protein HYW94_01315 [Candidatus Uhrbacteria bacterium]|nr:hypothetical protein [Candidatus Uhrbacteria bacterium]